MLEALRGKLHIIQQDLSSGIEKLRNRRSPSVYGSSSSSTFGCGLSSSISTPSLVNIDAGGEILAHYKKGWRLTHELSDQSVASADLCSDFLNNLQCSIRKQTNGIGLLNRQLGSLQKLSEQMSDLFSLAANIQDLCCRIDSDLAYLQVLTETEDFQDRKLDAKFALALDREARIVQLTETKTRLKVDHEERMKVKRRIKEAECERKRCVYQEAFERDVQLFKNTGLIAMACLVDSVNHDNLICVSPPEQQQQQQQQQQQPRMIIDIAWDSFGPLPSIDEQLDLHNFLADIKLEDSGIEGSECSSDVQIPNSEKIPKPKPKPNS